MSLSSLFRKNKQETPDDDNSFSRAKDEPNPKRARARRKSAADDNAADPVLPEKKRARRRLIGAVALVLAAVIGLPMVLDSEPKPLAQDIDIKIPSKDDPATPRRLPQAAGLDPAEQILEPVEHGSEQPVTAGTDKSAAPATTAATAASASQQPKPANAAKPEMQALRMQVADSATDKLAAAAADKASGAEPPAAATIEVKPAAKPDAQPRDSKAGVKPVAASEREAERAMAILEGKSGAKPEAGNKPGRYTIQVAALSSQDKVNELRGKLKAAGIASQTQKVPTASGERTRVRVGPFASKEEAEKMRARLVKLGLNGSLVPLAE